MRCGFYARAVIVVALSGVNCCLVDALSLSLILTQVVLPHLSDCLAIADAPPPGLGVGHIEQVHVLEFRVVGFRDVRNTARQLARDARVGGFAHRTAKDAVTVRVCALDRQHLLAFQEAAARMEWSVGIDAREVIRRLSSDEADIRAARSRFELKPTALIHSAAHEDVSSDSSSARSKASSMSRL